MKPHEPYTNGDADYGGSEEEADDEDDLSLNDSTWPARALASLNALRKSRQHYDVVVAAGGVELPAHRAVLGAASPRLLAALAPPQAASEPAAAHAIEGVTAQALQELLEFAYTGRLRVTSPTQARALYSAAWTLRVEPARAHLASVLLRRLSPADCLAVRTLPGLKEKREAIDEFIDEHFDDLASSGALSSLPVIQVEMMRESSADDGEESPTAVAAAALSWLRDLMQGEVDLAEVCGRPHLLYVDASGALRDCGGLPARGSDAPELTEYRRAAEARGRSALPGPALTGEQGDWAVLGVRRAGPRATRALLALGGRLAAGHIAWRAVRSPVPRGAPLGAGAKDEGEHIASMSQGRCAHGTAALAGRLLVVGGYDRAQALRSAESYDPGTNSWSALSDLRGARARFPAARLGDCVYAVGGSDGQAELDSVLVFKDGGWSARAKLPLARSHAAAAADEASGQLYCVGGWNAGVSIRTVHKYSPEKNEWSEAPSLNIGRSQSAAVVWEGALWALGGCDAWHCLASTETLPLPETASAGWATGPPLPTARRSVGGCVWRGRLVSAGGSDGAASLPRTDWLAPGGERWVAGPSLRAARAGCGLAVLDDVMYAVGGFSGKEFLASAESLRDPDGEWTFLRDPPPLHRVSSRPEDIAKEFALDEKRTAIEDKKPQEEEA